MSKLKQFLVAFLSFLVLDFIWLGFIVKDFNLKQLAEIGRIENGEFQILYVPAMFTYLLMALAIPLYILPRLSKEDSLLRKFLTGGIMGLIVYGVFDTTNLAILKNYPLAFVIPDILWGTFVFGIVTLITSRLSSK